MRAGPALPLDASMRQYSSRLWYYAYVSTSDYAFLEETGRAEQKKEAYLTLIAAHDPQIRTLLD